MQLDQIGEIERRLWKSADTLRANSNYASNEYFMPVMGLIFLRYAYNRFLAVKDEIEESLPTRGGEKRPISKEDFSQKSAIYLRENARFDYLVSLTDEDDRAQAIIDAMESIEEDYASLQGVLPKNEYSELDNEVLGQLLRILNPEELKRASGDVFGRIYEYFLTQFADQKAHDDGEFFTPFSLVTLIANVLEPTKGTILDPACGSGGMFVQSARLAEQRGANPSERLTFYGLEKNRTTINLAKMNLAIHGLEGNIQQARTYYEDPHEMQGQADYVMANPPFNVNEVDAEKVKGDPRLPFGLPSVNKEKKVSSANYLWISYFYSYLNETGKAGFVMSSQASSAGGKEAEVRQRLIETNSVDAMIAIRQKFFYTRDVPCELWFLNRDKPEEQKDKVLMIDARDIYRSVSSSVNDFTPEQMQNICSIVWLYRGENQRFVDLIAQYLQWTVEEARHTLNPDQDSEDSISQFEDATRKLTQHMEPFLNNLIEQASDNETFSKLQEERQALKDTAQSFQERLGSINAASAQDASLAQVKESKADIDELVELADALKDKAESVFKQCSQLVDECNNDESISAQADWSSRQVKNLLTAVEKSRDSLASELERIRYFQNQAEWLLTRFPDAEIRDVPGLVKVVDRSEIEKNDWSLTPGRYVGVAPQEEDDDFDYRTELRQIHTELAALDKEANELSNKIQHTFEEMGA